MGYVELLGEGRRELPKERKQHSLGGGGFRPTKLIGWLTIGGSERKEVDDWE